MQRKGNAFDSGVSADGRLLDSISRRTPKAAGMMVTHTHSGTILTPRKKKNKATNKVVGPFCKVFLDDDKIMLTGGVVTGGGTNQTIPDIELATVEDEPEDGWYVWLTINGDAVTEDDVLLPGFDLTSVTVKQGEMVPEKNKIPTVSRPSGTIYVSLGSWSGRKFVPAGCGNYQVTHCPGSLTHFRS
jgi:hypothetical protein